MNIEKAIAASVEPLVDQIVTLEKRIEEITLKPGEPGKDGKDADIEAVAKALADNYDIRGEKGEAGKDGAHGVGITATRWEKDKGYNAGEIVEWNLGQYFTAIEPNSDAEPGRSKFWKRIGLLGLRHTGGFDAEFKYEAGDLYVKDFATFMVLQSGEAKLLIPAPRVDKATGAIVVDAVGRGEVQTKYGNKIEFDFKALIDKIKEETADVMATDVKRLLADVTQTKDAINQAVEKAHKQQEDVLFETVIGLVADAVKEERKQFDAVLAELRAEIETLKGAR